MPLYEYECTKCRKRTEKIENASGPHLRKCPHCGGKVERVLTAPAIQFKGTGWYVTDYSGKKSSTSDAPAAESASAKNSADAPKEAPPKETKDKKPAKK